MPCKNFSLQELLPSSMFKSNPTWEVFDSKFLLTIDAIRDTLKMKMICNTWFLPKDKQAVYGTFEYRGYRPQGCGVGTPTGAHYKGLAGDFDFFDAKGVKVPPKVIIDLILKNRKSFPYLVALEKNVNWNHIDVMNAQYSSLRQIPTGKIMLFDANNNISFV